MNQISETILFYFFITNNINNEAGIIIISCGYLKINGISLVEPVFLELILLF
jgi:hypothetical protein